MISMRSIAVIGMASGPSQLPEVERKAIECPSIISLMTPLSENNPPETPRTATLGEMLSSMM